MGGFGDILGALVQNGLSSSASDRMANAFGGGESQTFRDIVDSLGSIFGGGQPRGSSGLGGILGNVLSNLGNNPAAAGGLGALGGALFGHRGASARGAVGGGALALLASVAFSALKNAGHSSVETPRALVGAETEEHQQQLDQDAEVIVKAMINAAKADGAIDQTEMKRIAGKLEEGGMTSEEIEFFKTEASKPFDMQGVINSAEGRIDLAAQIYAASLLAIEVDTDQERQYLSNLTSGLGLSDETVHHIETSLGVQSTG